MPFFIRFIKHFEVFNKFLLFALHRSFSVWHVARSIYTNSQQLTQKLNIWNAILICCFYFDLCVRFSLFTTLIFVDCEKCVLLQHVHVKRLQRIEKMKMNETEANDKKKQKIYLSNEFRVKGSRQHIHILAHWHTHTHHSPRTTKRMTFGVHSQS